MLDAIVVPVDRLVAYLAGLTSSATSPAVTIPASNRTTRSRCPKRWASSPVVVPDEPALLSLDTLMAAPLCAGCTVSRSSARATRCRASALDEVLATSGVPGLADVLIRGASSSRRRSPCAGWWRNIPAAVPQRLWSYDPPRHIPQDACQVAMKSIWHHHPCLARRWRRRCSQRLTVMGG
jgi:hypothetical protein